MPERSATLIIGEKTGIAESSKLQTCRSATLAVVPSDLQSPFLSQKEILECGDRLRRTHPLAEEMIFLSHPAHQIFPSAASTAFLEIATASAGKAQISRATFCASHDSVARWNDGIDESRLAGILSAHGPPMTSIEKARW